MNENVQRFVFDPAALVLFFALTTGFTAMLVLLFGRLGGLFGKVVAPGSSKLASLEGLRGVLASAVVAHHAYCWYFYSRTGAWGWGHSIIFERLATFGVIQFFYLSGFLFWRKLMKGGSIPFGNFYLSRFVRIGPAYYASVGAAILIGLCVTGFSLKVGIGALLSSLLVWLLFSFGGRPDVNHAEIVRITCGVTWTLALEWQFYLLLPLLGWFSRQARRLVVLAMTFGAVYLVGAFLRLGAPDVFGSHIAGEFLDGLAKFMLVGFGGGILVATLELRIRKWVGFLRPWQNWIVLGLYLAYLMVPKIHGVGQIFLLIGFALVVEGANLFGFLTSRAVRLLGVISYPLYLVHGIVYYLAMRLRGGLHAVSLVPYMAETAACLAVILMLATIIHLVVERPTMKLSEDIARRARLPQTGLLDQPAAAESPSRS